MLKDILCATIFGLESKIVNVQSTFSRGLPSFSITGLASNSIQEAKHRIQSALIFNNFKLPNFKITINLYPSDLPKSGSHFDLPIALLIATQNQNINFNNWFVFGELGLDGYIRDSQLIYPLILGITKEYKNFNILLPRESEKLYFNIPNINIYYASNIIEAIEIIKNPIKNSMNYHFNFKYIEVDSKEYYYDNNFKEDFSDVKGQTIAKRAALIAVTGMHNIIFEGSPGCGKSMIAKRMQYILPPISFDEMCECSRIKTLSNMDNSYTPTRPFRNPHQSSSKASILGSVIQNNLRPGEIALSHNGILFFDELLNFNKNILEAMREPLENNTLSISRVNIKFTYLASILFVGAMNPCPCGNLYSVNKECRCNELEINRYQNKLSEPFRDRIDIFVKMEETKSDNIITSKEMFDKVISAFIMQKERKQDKPNGKLSDSDIDRFCKLDEDATRLLKIAIDKFSLSYRGIKKIMKVSRSIADLDGSKLITNAHFLEALSFRRV